MPPPKTVIPEGFSPPDGGYGWVVAAAYALNNIITIPIIQNFGLLFRDLFKELNISGTDIAVIMNTNNAFGFALGLFYGPILRRFSYRKVSFVGSLLIFTGVALTSFARSFVEFLLFYGIIMSAGSGITMSSFTYAVNSYFLKRRSMAMGFAMTVTGLGPVFMPILISLAMKEYGARSTALLLAALSLHSTVGALLLQPVRWHLVKKDNNGDANGNGKVREMVDFSSKAEGLEILPENPEDEEAEEQRMKERAAGEVQEDEDADTKAPMLTRRRYSNASHRSGAYSRSASVEPQSRGVGQSVWASMASINSDAGLGGSVVALDLEDPGKAANGVGRKVEQPKGVLVKEGEKQEEPESCGQRVSRWLKAAVAFFDLDLLKDPIYINLMLGLSFAVFAEINFSLMTPFILGDRNFNTQEIATLVSFLAIADIVFRFLAPFVKRIVKQPVRIMYLFGLSLLILTRTVLIFTETYPALVAVMIALGVAKGLRTVYWVLVIPDYVPIERLPAASGLMSVTNGIVFMSLGPLVGVIRDKLGNYNYVIVAVNVMTTLCIVMWSTEFVIMGIRRRRRARENAVDAERMAKS